MSTTKTTTTPPLLLITGTPGVGKTTILGRVAEALGFIPRRGFVTEELRTGGRRHGFRLLDFEGRDVTLAHHKMRLPHTVGRYGVDVAALDVFVGPAMKLDPSARVYLIDEVGPMECLSEKFVVAMRKLCDHAGAPIVATVALRGTGFVAEVKARKGAVLWEATVDNRSAMPHRVVEWVMGAR